MAELPHNARSFGATQRYGDASRQALPRVGRNRLALQTVSSSVVLHAAGCTTFPRVSESEALNAEGTELAKRGALVEALALYERALALDPSLAKAENNRGSVLRKLGRTEEARASFERALRLGPGELFPTSRQSLPRRDASPTSTRSPRRSIQRAKRTFGLRSPTRRRRSRRAQQS